MVSLALVGRGVVDGLANFVSGIGTGKDKASQYTYTYTPLDQRTIEAAYAVDWLARKIIDVLPQDMCREWRVWQWDKASDCYELERAEGPHEGAPGAEARAPLWRLRDPHR